ncbi:MIZ/SP-RING zinc finger-domain-containing protein [Ilyonectria destructans]|nr:MIZ/SP-RING zinc finger-domain-containing protein [Ilyonectria destructans]
MSCSIVSLRTSIDYSPPFVDEVSCDPNTVKIIQQNVAKELQTQAATKRHPVSNPPPPATSEGSATRRRSATKRRNVARPVHVTATSTRSLERPVLASLGSLGEPMHAVHPVGHRSITVELNVNSHVHLKHGREDRNARVMIFYTAKDLVQPQLLVNSKEVKVNLDGPNIRRVDVTPYFGFGKNDTNKIEFTYRSSKLITAFAVNRCTYTSSQELVDQIPWRISKQSVVEQCTKESQSSDVIITSRVMSLMCPLSKARLNIPCRGRSCAHNRCFDAMSYFKLQIQDPTWECPICSNSVPFHELAIDNDNKRAASVIDLTLSLDDIRPAKRSKP